LFPDFAIHPRHAPGDRWFVEIVGFWTAEYLAAKLDRLRAARIANLVLCIDEDRNVGSRDLPTRTRIVRYRRRIDPSAVLRALRGG
jgi:predicted nuclease of restriction endonuclease-like RecB superfamily